MRIKRKDGSRKWYVSRFVEEHNHELAYGKLVDYLRSHRKISEVEVAQLTSMREIGISIPKIYESFAAQLRGFNLLTFTKQDIYNEVRKQRGLQGGDEDYLLFGDVLAFDATYDRNKYNLPVVVFSGVNHHNQTCVFGTAMVSCESPESYIWVLEQFLECMQGKAPQSVITDGDSAMRIAIQSIFSDAHHRCESLHAKLGRFVESRYGILEFVTNFQRCVDFLRDNEDELEFCAWYGTPVLQTEFVELEKSAWTKFTREMFARFRESLKRCVCVRICEINKTLHPHVYTLQKYRRPEMTWQIYREPTSNIFSCTCIRMESFGIPCVHIVAVCVRLDLAEIPQSLVLRKWSKTAKMEIKNEIVDHHTADQSVTYRIRLGAFSQLCKRLWRVACMSDDDFKVYSKKVLSNAVFLEIKYGLRPPSNIPTPAIDNVVKDPIRVRTKGTGRCSQDGGSAAKTKRKCSTCGKLGHQRTRCPNGDTPAATTNETATAGGHKRKQSKVIL
ncbi:protein FAR1-RELATED SEQUENCE 5-like [Arachis hypogaea]|uniref:protein FAR1-RELATED SEQUENCE 5-like n=1 Tax=Arachis hypogaea TaxID=3818 RepID=UPI000DEC9A69|nr:protein FAR1-RELATED SEQUENCE 5-like [Arachis hypogaea]